MIIRLNLIQSIKTFLEIHNMNIFSKIKNNCIFCFTLLKKLEKNVYEISYINCQDFLSPTTFCSLKSLANLYKKIRYLYNV